MPKKTFTPTAMFETLSWDLERIHELTQGWDTELSQLKRGQLKVDMQMFSTPHIQFSKMHYSNALLIKGSQPPGTVILSLIRTNKPVYSQNQTVEPYELVVVREGEEVDYIASGENEVLSLAIEKGFFERNFLLYLGIDFKEIEGQKRLLLKKESVDHFIDAMQKWISYFQTHDPMKISLEHYYTIEQTILEQLFSLIILQEGSAKRERFDLAKVREIIHENVDNIYTIGDLLNQTNVSARTLQHHFRKKFNLTPKQYLQSLRLNAVRRELTITTPQRDAVSEAALKYGFFNASHFAAEYKKMFGETPSQTLHRHT